MIGNASFQVRHNSRLSVERGATLNAVSLLHLLTGAVHSIVLPTLTAGIRGTGVYAEIFAAQGDRNHFCNCYGIVDVGAGTEKRASQADYHQAFWADANPNPEGKFLTPAGALNHSDEEMEFLAGLVAQRTSWQLAGRKGNRDASGSMTYQNASVTLSTPRPRRFAAS